MKKHFPKSQVLDAYRPAILNTNTSSSPVVDTELTGNDAEVETHKHLMIYRQTNHLASTSDVPVNSTPSNVNASLSAK